MSSPLLPSQTPFLPLSVYQTSFILFHSFLIHFQLVSLFSYPISLCFRFFNLFYRLSLSLYFPSLYFLTMPFLTPPLSPSLIMLLSFPFLFLLLTCLPGHFVFFLSLLLARYLHPYFFPLLPFFTSFSL